MEGIHKGSSDGVQCWSFFGPHPAKMSTLHPFPSGAGSCTQPCRALSPSQERNSAEPSPAPLQELGELMMEYGGGWRDTWLLAGQRGWRGRSWEGTLFLGNGEGKDEERMGALAHGGGAE